MENITIVLTENQKVILDLYIYTCNDYDLAMDYLKKLGVKNSDFNLVIKQLRS